MAAVTVTDSRTATLMVKSITRVSLGVSVTIFLTTVTKPVSSACTSYNPSTGRLVITVPPIRVGHRRPPQPRILVANADRHAGQIVAPIAGHGALNRAGHPLRRNGMADREDGDD